MLARVVASFSVLFFGALLLMGLDRVEQIKGPAESDISLVEPERQVDDTDSQCRQKLNVVVTVAPIAQIVRDIGGHCIHVDTLIAPGGDPHHYALKPSDIKNMRLADGIIWLGPTLEPFLKKNLSSLPLAQQLALETFVSTDDLHFEENRHEHEHEHEHGHEDEDIDESEHEVFDPHIWFSLDSRTAMVSAIADWLTKNVGVKEESTVTLFHSRAAEMNRQWQQEIVERIASWTTDSRRRSILVDHNAYSYLFDELGLNSIGAVQPNHEVKASIKHVLALKALAKEAEPLCVVIQPNADEALIKKILNGVQYRQAVIDPMLRLYLNEKINKPNFSSIQSMQSVISELLECANSKF